MSSIAVTASASGTGVVSLQAPITSTNRTISLPDATGTMLTDQSDILTQTKAALNASNGAPIYACRAWVNFNGTGAVAIRASGNVSSITDNATGDYTVNFATAMPDANYCSQITAQGGAAGSTNRVFGAIKLGTTPNTTAVAVIFADEAAGVFADPLSCYFAIFR